MVKSENLLLFLNTKDRTQTDASAALSDFTFPINHIADRVGEATFHLLKAEIPNVMYPISAARKNSTIYFQEDGSTATTFSATLADNVYTGNQLATALKTAMDASVAVNTYTVTYDSQSLKITIATNGTSVKIVTGTNSIEKELGVLVSQAFAATYACAYPVYLSGSKYIDLMIGSLYNNNISTSTGMNLLYRVQMNAPFGAMVYHNAFQEEKIRVRVTDLQNIRVQFLDDKGLEVSLPLNHDISLTLKLTYDYS